MKIRNAIHLFKTFRNRDNKPAIGGRRFKRASARLAVTDFRKCLPVDWKQECRWTVAAFVAAIAAASAVAQTNEILVNGHFESPAMSGDGDVWSSSAAFALPGWTYPTGSNQLYLEFGRPLGTWRYTDGRQAICLHGQGTPVSISQAFPTIPGQNYTLSFAQSDETNSGPSQSQLSVSVAGVFRTFSNYGGYHVYDDHGYKINAMSFTAQSNTTTLTFTDVSPAGVPSPMLDAVCVNAGNSAAMISGAPVPNSDPAGTNQFVSFGPPAVSSSPSQCAAVFLGVGSGGSQGLYACDGYCATWFPHFGPPFPPPPPPDWLVDTTVSIPNGVGTFQRLAPGSTVELNPQPYPPVAVGGDTAFFWGAGSGGQQGFYSVSGFSSHSPGPIQRLVDTQTLMPGRTEYFSTFVPSLNGTSYAPQISAAGENVALWGQGADDWEEIICLSIPHYVGPPPPPQLNVVADLATFIPGSSVTFSTFLNPSLAQEPVPLPWKQVAIRGNNIVFYGAGPSALGLQGLYCAPVPAAGTVANQSNLFTVADTTMPIPGGTNNFTGFGAFDFAASATKLNVAYIGTGSGGQLGVFDDDVPYCGTPPIPLPGPGPSWRVADLNSEIPQGVGNFTGFGGVACGGGQFGVSVAFLGLGANGQKGIYAMPSPSPAGVPAFPLAKIVDLNDTIDGKTIADLQLGPGAIDGFVLAYTAVFTDGSRGVYIAPLVCNVAITSLAFSGGDVQLNFTAPASHNFSIVGSTDVTQFGASGTVVSGGMGTGGLGACVVPGGFSPLHTGYFYTVKWSGTDPGEPQFNGSAGR